MKGSVGVSVGLCFLVLLLPAPSISKEDKPAEATKQDLKMWWINWGNLDVVDFLRSAFLMIAFLVTVLGDKRGRSRYGSGPWRWAAADTLGTFLAGLACFFFPAGMLAYETTAKVDMMHIMELQMTGAVLVGMAVTTFSMSNLGSDPLAGSSWIVIRVVGGMCLLWTMAYGQIWLGILTDQHATFIIFGTKLWLFGSFVQLFRSGASQGVSRPSMDSCVSMHLLIDVLINLPMTMMAMAVPEAFCEMYGLPFDPLLGHLCRITATFFMMTCLHGLVTLFNDNDSDKRALLSGRVITCAMVLTLVALYQWKYQILTRNSFLAQLFTTGIILANAAGACFRNPAHAKRL